MADGTDEVLELGEDLELQVADELEDKEGDGEGGSTDFVFADEVEAAPASEDTSVIRDLRKAFREAARERDELRRIVAPKPVEVGPKPTLADCDYDEDVFDQRSTEWHEANARAKAEAKQAEEQRQAVETEWTKRAETYKAAKSESRIAGIDEAEETVKAALSDQQFALLMLEPDAAPKLIAALAKSPAKLDALAKLDLARAAMMVGKLGASVQMTTRSTMSPERKIAGNAGFSGGTANKRLSQLKAKAEQSGEYTEYLAAKREAKA